MKRVKIEGTMQEVFDKVYKHLLQQGGPAVDGDSSKCMYRAIDGKKCAVGCLILDADYSPEFEGKIVWDVIEPRMDVTNNFLRAMQRVHDEFDTRDPTKNWIKYVKDEFAKLAMRNKLIIPEV